MAYPELDTFAKVLRNLVVLITFCARWENRILNEAVVGVKAGVATLEKALEVPLKRGAIVGVEDTLKEMRKHFEMLEGKGSWLNQYAQSSGSRVQAVGLRKSYVVKTRFDGRHISERTHPDKKKAKEAMIMGPARWETRLERLIRERREAMAALNSPDGIDPAGAKVGGIEGEKRGDATESSKLPVPPSWSFAGIEGDDQAGAADQTENPVPVSEGVGENGGGNGWRSRE